MLINNKPPKPLSLVEAYRYKYELSQDNYDNWKFRIVKTDDPSVFHIRVYDDEGFNLGLWPDYDA